MKDGFEIEDEWLPMEIHTETPQSGARLTELFEAAALEKMFVNLKNMGKHYKIEFNGNNVLSNSHLALAAGEYAKEVGRAGEYNEGIFKAYFTEGQDIGNIEVILRVAEEINLSREILRERLETGYYDNALREVLDRAHKYGINSTPTFIIDDEYAIVGAQPLEVFVNLLHKLDKHSG